MRLPLINLFWNMNPEICALLDFTQRRMGYHTDVSGQRISVIVKSQVVQEDAMHTKQKYARRALWY